MIAEIVLQYDPDTLLRSYQLRCARGDGGGECAQPFRPGSKAIESIKPDGELDGTVALEYPDQNANAVVFGIALQIAAPESLVNTRRAKLLSINALSQAATGNPAARGHSYYVKGCDPFISKPAAPPSQGRRKPAPPWARNEP